MAAGRGLSSGAIASADPQRGLVAGHSSKSGTGRAHIRGTAWVACPCWRLKAAGRGLSSGAIASADPQRGLVAGDSSTSGTGRTHVWAISDQQSNFT